MQKNVLTGNFVCTHIYHISAVKWWVMIKDIVLKYCSTYYSMRWHSNFHFGILLSVLISSYFVIQERSITNNFFLKKILVLCARELQGCTWNCLWFRKGLTQITCHFWSFVSFERKCVLKCCNWKTHRTNFGFAMIYEMNYGYLLFRTSWQIPSNIFLMHALFSSQSFISYYLAFLLILE